CVIVTNPEGSWDEGVVRSECAHDPRSRGAEGCRAGPRTDLRGGPAAGTIRLSTGPQGPGRGTRGPGLGEHGAYGSSGRGLERLVRQHPAHRAVEVGEPSSQ